MPGTLEAFADERVAVYHGECRELLRALSADCIDAVVTDPPYELAFMGRKWDATGIAYDVAMWREAYRVLKPGGHLLAFGGSRTWHRLAVAIEDAGFELRDSIAWMYGSGFPKSLDVSKAIDKTAGAEREVVGDKLDRPGYHLNGHNSGTGALGQGISATTPETRLRAALITAPATDDARRWQGWGTALKPGFEPIVVARKPLVGTVAANVLAFGTGALNIDACRVGSPEDKRAAGTKTYQRFDPGSPGKEVQPAPHDGLGRWPTNVVLSHPPLLDADGAVIGDACADGCVPVGCPVAELDAQSGVLTSGANPTQRGSDKFRDAYGDFRGQTECVPARGADSGGASRFFPVFRYQAKAPTRERPRVDGVAHPTVKPLELMRWMVRLVTPPNGLILDHFAGSGTTLEAAALEGFRAIGVEREADHLPLIRVRMERLPAREKSA